MDDLRSSSQPSPPRIAVSSSKPPKTVITVLSPSSSSKGEKDNGKSSSWQKAKKKKKNVVRRLGESLFGLLACGSHVGIVSSSDDEDSRCAESLLKSTPIRSGTNQNARRPTAVDTNIPTRSTPPKKQGKKIEPSSNWDKQRDCRTPSSFSNSRSFCYETSDAEDLAIWRREARRVRNRESAAATRQLLAKGKAWV